MNTPGSPASSSFVPETLQLLWLTRIRWVAIVSLCAIFFGADFAFDLGLNPVPIVVLVCAAGVSNCALGLWGARRQRSGRFVAGWVLLFDVVLLAGLLYFSGGYTNPFSMMFLGYVTLAAFFLNARWTWLVFAVSLVCFFTLFFFHIPIPQLAGHAHHGHDSGLSLHLHGMLVAFALIGGIVAFFVTRMNREIAEQAEQITLLQKAQQERQRLISLATLTAGAAHELATPIATLSLIGEDLTGALSDDPVWGDDVKVMQTELARCAAILRRMRGQHTELVGETPTRFTGGELKEQLLSHLDGAEMVRFEGHGGELPIYCLQRSLVASLQALIRNGLQACAGAGHVACQMALGEDEVVFTVTDNGVGMTEEAKSRAGEPFFTSKEPGQGMGLGLYLTKLFALQVGGRLEILSTLGLGTVVTLTIPREMKV